MFIDDDDWFIGDDAIQKVLDFAYEHSKWDICRFGFHWNMNYIRGCFVWQYIFKRKVFDKYRFQGKVAQEDVLIMREIYGDLGTHEYNRNVFPTLNEEIYYYNYPREGSILDRLHKGEIERPE